jgi:hypothetical protein
MRWVISRGERERDGEEFADDEICIGELGALGYFSPRDGASHAEWFTVHRPDTHTPTTRPYPGGTGTYESSFVICGRCFPTPVSRRPRTVTRTNPPCVDPNHGLTADQGMAAPTNRPPTNPTNDFSGRLDEHGPDACVIEPVVRDKDRSS